MGSLEIEIVNTVDVCSLGQITTGLTGVAEKMQPMA